MTTKLQTYTKYKSSGIDWLGDIPAGWDTKRNLGLFSERNERVKHFVKDDLELLSVTIQKGVVRQLELAEDEQRKDSSNEDKGNYKWVRRGDIAYNKMRMWQGAAGESKYEGIVSPAYIILKPKTGVLPRYFHYFFRTEMFNEIAYQYGYGIADDQHSLRYWQFKILYSPFPSLETQKQIADFLDEKTKVIDELVAKKEKLIELLREKRAALITRAVTKGLDPKTKLKPSGIDWLSNIPEGWGVKKIKHVTSANKKSLSEDSTDPDYEFDYVDIGNVNSEGKILELQNYFFANAPARARRLAENGDVIISTVRTYLRSMMRIENAKGLVFSTGFTIFHPTKIFASQLYWSMQSETFLAQVMANSTGVNYPGINEQKLSSISLPIPSEQEQKQITDFLDTETAKIDKAVTLIESQIEELKEYRSSLIYHAVTGKIKV